MLYKKFEIELLNDNSCSIKKFKGKESSVVVPQEVEISGKAYTVTAIGKAAFAEKDALEEVRLPETITSIGESAFEECRNLQKSICQRASPTLARMLYAAPILTWAVSFTTKTPKCMVGSAMRSF